MALQLGSLRDALISAGVEPAKAGDAAAEVASYGDRVASIETKLAVLMVMVGGLYALVAPSLWLLLRIAVKTGSVSA